MAIHNQIIYPVQQIGRWIAEGRTHESIAEQLRESLDPRVTAKLVGKVCKKARFECQRRGPRSGPGHPEWKGGVRINRLGYVQVYQPEHPTCIEANKRRASKSGGKYFRKMNYVWEHRLVMEEHLGRFLLPGEVVHHRNDDRSDNHLGNLRL